MSKILELRAERHAISVKMNECVTAGLEKPEQLATWKTLDAQQEILRSQIDAMEKTEQISNDLAAVRNVDRPVIGAEEVASQNVIGPQARALQLRATPDYKSDFEKFLRTGKESKVMTEIRALGAASGADGATLVPQGFEDELIVKLKAYGGMTRLCRQITTSTGNPLPWPNLDDTTNVGEWLTEAAGVGSADPTFSNVTLGANLLSSKQVKISVQLEQDSAFDIAGLLNNAFAIRMGRTSNLAFTVGDGTSTYGTITGLINALVAAGGRSQLAVGGFANSAVSGDTDLNTVGTDDLDNLISNTDPAYRAGAKFAANQATWDKLRGLKDKFGRPIWQTSLAVGVPDSIMGYGYDWNQDMAKIGAGNISVVFGQFDSYVVRQVLGFTFIRFNELYMANYQRAYQAFARMDGKLLQAAAFSYLIHPLS